MRVLHVIETIDPRTGGPASAFLETAQALAQHPRIEYHAVAHAPTGREALEGLDPGIAGRVQLAQRAGQLTRGDLAQRAIATLDEHAIECLHLHGLWNGDLVRIARAARARAIPYVWQPHGMLMRHAFATRRLKKEVFLAMGLGAALRRARAIVCCTAGEQQISVGLDRYAGGRSEVVSLPVSCPVGDEEVGALRARARTSFGVPPDAPALVYMGRVHPVKRLDLTLEAFAHAAGDMPDLTFHVFGEGDKDLTRLLCERGEALGVSDRIHWHGWVERARRFEALALGDALILNSRFENFGYVICEAMLVHTRAIATRNLSMAGDLAGAPGAHVVDESPGALARAIVEACSTGPTPEARGWVRGYCAPERVAEQLLELYESVVSGRDPAGEGDPHG